MIAVATFSLRRLKMIEYDFDIQIFVIATSDYSCASPPVKRATISEPRMIAP